MDRDVELLPRLPALGPLFARSLLAGIGGRRAHVPSRTAMVTGVVQDRERLAGYDRVCGFALREEVPPTWLHVLTFPLQVHLLSDPASTIRLVGVVHVSNRMRRHRPVAAGERLDLSVRAANLRPHRRGVLVDLIGEARVSDTLVWDGVSTYLCPGAELDGPAPEAGDGRPAGQQAGPKRPAFEARDPLSTWRLPAGLGLDYRRVSGDPNPIHTNRLVARAFGFSRPIIHGMWTHARLLAALEPRLPATYEVSVDFTKPILLPATVGCWWQRDPDGWDAAVTTADGAKPHLLARITP